MLCIEELVPEIILLGIEEYHKQKISLQIFKRQITTYRSNNQAQNTQLFPCFSALTSVIEYRFIKLNCLFDDVGGDTSNLDDELDSKRTGEVGNKPQKIEEENLVTRSGYFCLFCYSSRIILASHIFPRFFFPTYL